MSDTIEPTQDELMHFMERDDIHDLWWAGAQDQSYHSFCTTLFPIIEEEKRKARKEGWINGYRYAYPSDTVEQSSNLYDFWIERLAELKQQSIKD